MKVCLICGEKVSQRAFRCSNGHASFLAESDLSGTLGKDHPKPAQDTNVFHMLESNLSSDEDKAGVSAILSQQAKSEDASSKLPQVTNERVEEALKQQSRERLYQAIDRERQELESERIRQRSDPAWKEKVEQDRVAKEETERAIRENARVERERQNARRIEERKLQERQYRLGRRDARYMSPLDPNQSKRFLIEHLRSVNFRREPLQNRSSDQQYHQFESNNQFWETILGSTKLSIKNVTLTGFQVIDWFPRTPGKFHTNEGRQSRWYAQDH